MDYKLKYLKYKKKYINLKAGYGEWLLKNEEKRVFKLNNMGCKKIVSLDIVEPKRLILKSDDMIKEGDNEYISGNIINYDTIKSNLDSYNKFKCSYKDKNNINNQSINFNNLEEFLNLELNDQTFNLIISPELETLDYDTTGKNLNQWIRWNPFDIDNLLKEMLKYYSNIEALNYNTNSKTKVAENDLYINIIMNTDELFNYIIIGDIHGSLIPLQKILESLKEKKIIDKDYKIKDSYYLIFLGDIIDRGPYGIELLLIAFKLKMVNKDKVIIINGNHEDKSVYSSYGFEKELQFEIELFSEENNPGLNNIKENIEKILTLLPSCIFINNNNEGKWYQLCHGGINSDYIEELKIILDASFKQKSKYDNQIVSIRLAGESYNNGFKWSDFGVAPHRILYIDTIKLENSEKEEEKKEIKRYDSGRGKKLYLFDYEGTFNYIEYLNIKSIIRGHQDSKMLQFLSYQTDSNEFYLNFFYGKRNSNSVANIAKLNSDNLYEIENKQPNINIEFRIKMMIL